MSADSDGAGDLPSGMVCTPGVAYCEGRTRRVCDGDGAGPDPAQDALCAFTCVGGRCVFPANLTPVQYQDCTGAAAALAPPAGGSVTLQGATQPVIACTPHCGAAGTTEIAGTLIEQAGGPQLALFCLAAVDLPADVTFVAAAGLPYAVVLFVDGAATVAGAIDVGGADAAGQTAGAGGPGGAAGGPFNGNAAGVAGGGPCPGGGGERTGSSENRASGGGGGGGFGGAGGQGGQGQNKTGSAIAVGGAGGDVCGGVLAPLVGGSGGGSGADGNCSGSCSWPGGGGGGAFHLVSRVSVEVTGTIDASGGAGFGHASGVGSHGAGGGGGSGGAILVEAPLLVLSGDHRLVVDGGAGGPASAGAGGAGASGPSAGGAAGADQQGFNQAGSGGGGGGGRVVLRAATAPSCGVVASPEPVCSAGTLAETSP